MKMKNRIILGSIVALAIAVIVPACQKYEEGPGVSLRRKIQRIVNTDEGPWQTSWYDPYGVALDASQGVSFGDTGPNDVWTFDGSLPVAACAGGMTNLQFKKDGTVSGQFYSPVGTLDAKSWNGWYDPEGLVGKVGLVTVPGTWEWDDRKEALRIVFVFPTTGDWSDPDEVGFPISGWTMDIYCDIIKLSNKQVKLEFNWGADRFGLLLDQICCY